MADASIPIDLFNPGQVFACLGFLEAAEVLLGDAEGGFSWNDEMDIRYVLRAKGDENPFEAVLKFLTTAEVRRFAPVGYRDPPPKTKKGKNQPESDDDDQEDSSNLEFLDSFPNREGDRMSLPIQFKSAEQPTIDLGHWADGSSRHEFKLYAGNRSAYTIARDMLQGKRSKPTKTHPKGKIQKKGLCQLWHEHQTNLVNDPFNVITSMGGSFNFDPRGAWTALDAGFSPDQQKKVGNIDGVAASPVVEILAAWGLEHARPDEYKTRRVRYGVWSGLLPLILARPALAGHDIGIPIRRFEFELDLSGKNKVITFAHEEIN